MPMLVDETTPAGDGDRSLVARMLRAAKLDATLYEEIERDPKPFGQAAGIVAIQSAAAAVGSLNVNRLPSLPVHLVVAVGTWLVGSAVVWLIGDRAMREHDHDTPFADVALALGFAVAPGTALALAMLPVVGAPIALAVTLWLLASAVVAVKHVFGYAETWRAAVVVVVGGFVALVLASLFR